MKHLLPVLAEAGLNQVNFGPMITIEEIRRYFPEALILSQLDPLTLMRDDPETIVLEFLWDR